MQLRVLVVLITLIGSSNLALMAQMEGSGTSEGSATIEGSSASVAVPAPVVVLTGLDSVSLVQGQREQGLPAYSRVYNGFEYQFSSAANRSAFDASPEKYAVVNDGNCPVADARLHREIKGNPEIFAAYQGQIYLFGNQDALDVFQSDPTAIVHSAAREGSGSEAM